MHKGAPRPAVPADEDAAGFLLRPASHLAPRPTAPRHARRVTRGEKSVQSPPTSRTLPRSLHLRRVELVEELLRVRRRVVIDDLFGVAVGDGTDHVLELRTIVGLELEDLLERTRHDERAARRHVVRQHLCKLVDDVLQDLVRGVVQQRLERRQVDALLDDGLEGTLGLRLEVVGRCLVQVHGEQLRQRVCVRERLCVIGRVASDLAERPRRRRLDVVFGLGHDGVDEGRDALGDDHGERERLRERRDVAERHDAWQARVARGLGDIIDHGADTASVDDELRELGRVLGDLADARGGVLAHVHVHVLEQIQDLWEDLRLDDHLGQVDRVLGDLRKARAHLSLELAVGRDDERREVGDGATIDDRLRQLRRVLADVRERRRRDALQRELGLLDAKHEQRHGAGVDNSLSELAVVASDVA
mmetsp:Transcript_24156/g.61786  ORF Transcript_24156/g.61786 Transcript_24156/m.61786 type:complete len:418 (+) Transcript_24156:414-1667(+)